MNDLSHVCVFRTDRIGDLILTLPVAEAVRRAHPDARVTFVVQEYTAPLARLSPYVDDVVAISGRDAGMAEFPDLRDMMRREGVTHAVFAYPRPLLSLAAAAVRRRSGTAYRWYSWLYTDRVAEHRSEAVLHESHYNLNLLKPFGITADPGLRPRLSIDDALRERAREVLRRAGIDGQPFIVLHPGSGGSAKDWEPENFGALGLRLQETRPGLALLVTGTSAEHAVMARCAEAANGTARQLTEALPLDVLAGVLAEASACVANSTGPLHLAAAGDTPVLGLYPSQRVCSPVRWGPLGSSARTLTPPRVDGCAACMAADCSRHDVMRRISVDDALAALHSLLG